MAMRDQSGGDMDGARGALQRAGRMLWRFVRTPVLFTLNIIAALILLFEEWGWRPLANLLAWLARFRPWAAVERWIAGLPPYGALLIFALPTATLTPVKFLAMWLMAQGKVLMASGVFVAAKIASTAFVARIFMLTKPALMRIGWFARAYTWFIPWKEHLFAVIRASWVWRYGRMFKTKVRLTAQRALARWRPVLNIRWRAARNAAQRMTAPLRDAVRAAWRRITGRDPNGS